MSNKTEKRTPTIVANPKLNPSTRQKSAAAAAARAKTTGTYRKPGASGTSSSLLQNSVKFKGSDLSQGMITTGQTENDEANEVPKKPEPPKVNAPSFGTLMFMKKQMSNFQNRRGTLFQRRSSGLLAKKLPMENTYRMNPNDNEKYRSDLVADIVKRSLKFFLDGMKYEPVSCAKVSKVICDDIKRKLRYNFNNPRYKLVVQVVVVEKSEQTLCVASRAVMDSKLDSFAEAQYSQGSLCGSATVYWLYYE